MWALRQPPCCGVGSTQGRAGGGVQSWMHRLPWSPVSPPALLCLSVVEEACSRPHPPSPRIPHQSWRDMEPEGQGMCALLVLDLGLAEFQPLSFGVSYPDTAHRA